MAVVQNLHHERSAICVSCERPPAGRGIELTSGSDGKKRYLCQECVDAGVDPEMAQRCRDYRLLWPTLPFLCRDQHGCSSSHNPEGPCWLFESHTIDSDEVRVRMFSLHFGAGRPPWDAAALGVQHLEGFGPFENLDAAIGWLRANRPSWSGLRVNGGWF